MKSLIRFAGAAVAGLVLAGSLAQAAHADVRNPLLPPIGNLPFLAAHASGTQNYACSATATGFAWTFTGPRANLFDLRGRVIITHFGGPTWQANDGSKVVGTLSGTQTVDPNSIPWLLLSGKATPAPTGGGLLAKTTFIQRLLTRGGLAPAASTCNARTAGSTAAVPYTAEYVFWQSSRIS
jgi:Protein of unknown function (DUF3455)